MIKGQEKLINIFENMTIDQLPHTFMLLGEDGCGKHTLSKDIAEKFSLEYEDISTTISTELIMEIETIKVPTLYILNINELKDQNIILKFIFYRIMLYNIACSIFCYSIHCMIII